jgi:hypothetical protein
MLTKKEVIDLLDLLNKIEIKGEANIYFMYQILAFLKGKLAEAESKSKEE